MMADLEGVYIFDDFLPSPEIYREEALALEFRSFEFERCTFHGIAIDPVWDVPAKIQNMIPHYKPTLSFFRQSPEGQKEPHYIHSDIDMGKWSAVLYLNPDPPVEDGTVFWVHKETGTIGSLVPHERSVEGATPDQKRWIERGRVAAKFNRLALFDSYLFHSRSMFDNWGVEHGARLTQVVFGDYK